MEYLWEALVTAVIGSESCTYGRSSEETTQECDWRSLFQNISICAVATDRDLKCVWRVQSGVCVCLCVHVYQCSV